MHPFIRQWSLKLIHGQLGYLGSRCGGWHLWSLPSQREKDCSDGDKNYRYATHGATHDSDCI
jgi:hypothetical protein